MAELAVFVGERIRLLRRHRGLTQEALAERIGVTSESVSNIERAVHPPSLETLERILNALGIRPAVFFADEPFREPGE
jgi:transcriptional regulator with XRE-family HTH domain